jgi:ParB/RepB/Spo0J family partition protein
MKPIRMIPLSRIDLSDQTFSVNFMPDLERLRASIQEMGLLQPVLLREKPGNFQIVSGFRRISVAQELGFSEIESTLLEEEVEDVKLFSISLHENLTSRGFNTVERAMALEKLVDPFRLDPASIIRKWLPLFDLETNEKILNTFLSLARMEDEVKRYVLEEKVSRSNIRKLAALDADDRRAAMALLRSLKLGENSLRETLIFLREISRRDRCDVEAIIRLPEIQAILSHPDLTSNQKAERVKKILTGLRYPRMTQLEEEFHEKRRDLNLPSSIVLNPPPFFEGKGLRMTFQFHSIEEYRSILSSLTALGEKKEFHEMILGGGLERRSGALSN